MGLWRISGRRQTHPLILYNWKCSALVKRSNFSFLLSAKFKYLYIVSTLPDTSAVCAYPQKTYWLLKSHGWFFTFFHKFPPQIGNLSLCCGCFLFSNTFPLVVIPQISGNLLRKSLTVSSITSSPSNCTSCFSAYSPEQNESCLPGCSEICCLRILVSGMGWKVRLAETILKFMAVMAVFAITLWNVVRLPIGSSKLKSC